MTDSTGLRRLVGRIDRQYPRALELPRRLRRFGLKHVLDHQRELAAAVEQSTKAQERLEIYFDRFREEIRAEFGDLVVSAAELRSLLAVLEASAESGSDKPFDAGAALAARLEHAMLHAEALAIESRAQFAKELGELRSTVRLTQALAERTLHATPTLSEGDSTPSHPASPTRSVAPDPAFSHVVPSFDLLYRSFEDRHRGSIDEITERQSEDYLALLGDLPHPDLAIADLGCGRGELVQLLNSAGHRAIGVDSNLSQVVDGDEEKFWEQDLFQWLDEQADSSHRAIVSMHVVEHLPLDLQVRLVFESRRVLAEGGLLILETPNTLSLSVAASNFWVDPTHQRPVHPLFLEFLATEAGFGRVQTELLHPIGAEFPPTVSAEALVRDLNSLILGAGDMALIATR